MLLVSSLLLSVLVAAGGVFTIVLGAVHVGIPSILRYSAWFAGLAALHVAIAILEH